jgi:hypothetical protein
MTRRGTSDRLKAKRATRKRPELNGEFLREAIVRADRYLTENEELINALNIFPIPDGDTGTNMALTLRAALQRIKGTNKWPLDKLAQGLAQGALVGARGNSGVILAQFLDGFASTIDSKSAISFRQFATALERGTEEAYRAVADPKEGTILTVMRTAADKAGRFAEEDSLKAAKRTFAAANEALARTKEILPQLREAGVVDAGGLGFLYILKGSVEALTSEPIPLPIQGLLEEDLHRMTVYKHELKEALVTRFCLQFSIKGSSLNDEEIRAKLQESAESVVVAGGRRMKLAHVHIHTNDPDRALAIGASFGELSRVKLDDMHHQYQRFITGSLKKPEGGPALIPVVSGEGLVEIMHNLGAAEVIKADKMNPSVGEILEAIGVVPQFKVILLPNNKNVILAAEAAARLSEKEVLVVPSRSIPQGISAILASSSTGGELEEDVKEMTTAIQGVKSGEVTQAIRGTRLSGVKVKQGEYIGFLDGEFATSGKDLEETTLKLLEAMVTEEELITIFYGMKVSGEEASSLIERVESIYPEKEVQLYHGGQPYRHCIIAVE